MALVNIMVSYLVAWLGLWFMALMFPGTTQAQTPILSVPIFQDARKLPPVSCITNLAYGQDPESLLDTQQKRQEFLNGLKGERHDVFERILSSPDFDVSIFTPMYMEKALDHLTEAMSDTERESFFEGRAYLQNPLNMNHELEGVLQMWIPLIQLLQTKDVMCETNSLVPLEILGSMCDNLLVKKTGFTEVLLVNERCPDCTAFIISDRNNTENSNKVPGMKGKELYRKMRQLMPNGGWDIHMLRFSPHAVKPSDIHLIDSLHFLDHDQLRILTEEDVFWSFSKKVRLTLAERLMAEQGPFNTWSPDMQNRYGFLIMSLSSEALEADLTAEMFFDMHIEHDTIQSPAKEVQQFFLLGAWKIVEWLQNPANVVAFPSLPPHHKSRIFCLLAKFAPVPSLFTSVFTVEDIKMAVMECHFFHIDYRKMDFLIHILESDRTFTWTADNMLAVDYLMPAVPPSFLQNISAKDLREYWKHKQADMPIPSTKVIWEQMKDTIDLTTLTCQDMAIVQECLLVFTPDELDQIPLKVFGECTSAFVHTLDERCERNPRGCEYIWKLIKVSSMRMKNSLPSIMANMTKEYVRHFIPSQDLFDIPVGSKHDLADIVKIPLDDTQAAVLLRKVEYELGNISLSDSNLTEIDGLFEFFGRGATTDFIDREMPKGSELISQLDDATDMFKDSSKKKRDIVYKTLKEGFALHRRSTVVCLDDPLFDNMAIFFMQASEEDIDKLRPDSKEKVLTAIGKNEDIVKQMSRSKLRAFFHKQIMGTAMTTAGVFDLNHVEEVGPYLFCGMEKQDVKKLSDDVIKKYVGLLESCEQLDQETRALLAERVVNINGGLTSILERPALMSDMGTLFIYVNVEAAAGFSETQMETLDIWMTKMMDKVQKRSERLSVRSNADIPDDEKEMEGAMRSELMRKIFSAGHKGSSGPLDCASLQVFKGEIAFLNTTDIMEMKPHDFEDCIEDFQKTDWSDEQLEVIGHKLKEVFGMDAKKWDNDKMMKAGPLVRALPTDDILRLNFTEDSLAVVGKFDLGRNISSEIVRKYAMDKGFVDFSSMTGDELGVMGKLVCGMDIDMIGTLDPGVVSEAAHHLGEADCLDTDQLEEMGKKLEMDLGSDWSRLSPDKIADMGVLVGGASKDALASLRKDQIGNVNPKAIEKMPAKTLAEAFSADKLLEFSDEQALFLTPEHIWRMSPGQREAMNNFTRDAGISVPKANHGAKISDNGDFQTARTLPRVSCGSNLAFAGQRDNLLDTPQKVASYGRKLTGDVKDFFQQLIQSPNHDVSKFTDMDMDVTLKFLMDDLDHEGQQDYLDILNSFDYIPKDRMTEILNTWPPSIHLLQTESTMCEVTSMMDSDLLSTFCLRLTHDDVSAATVTEVLERCADCVVLGYNDRESDTVNFLLDEAKGAVFYRKLRQWKTNDWDLLTLAISPGAVKEDDVMRISDPIFQNETQLQILMDDRFQCCISEGVRRKIAERLYQTIGSLDSWTDEQIDTIGRFIMYLPTTVLKRDLTADFIMRALHHIEGMEDATQTEEKALTIAAWNLADHMMSNPNALSRHEKHRALCLIVKYAPSRSVFDTLYSADELKEGLLHCGHWNISKENSGRALATIYNAPGFTWTPDMFEMMANFSSAVTAAAFDTLDMNLINSNWEHIKEKNLSMPVLRSAWDKLKGNFTLATLTCAQIHEMGRMFFALSVKDLNAVPENTMGECASYIGDILQGACADNKGFCAKVWKKIKEYAITTKTPIGEIITSMSPDFLQYVPSQDFRGLSLDDLGGFDNLANLNLDSAQSEVVMEAVERELGHVSKDNLNYTGNQLEKMGHMFFKGAPLESLEMLPEGTELMESLPAIMENLEFMNEKKLKVVYDKLHTMFGMNSERDICLDDSTVKQAAGFFTQASKEDMWKLSDKTRLNMLTEIGNNADLVKTMTRENIKEHFKVLKESEGKTDFTSEEMEKYGVHLFCGMSQEDANTISGGALEEHLAELDKCEQLDTDTRTVIADKMLERFNGISGLVRDPEKLESMGTMLLHVDLTQADQLTSDEKQRLGSMVGKVMEDVDKRIEKMEKRSSSDIPSSEKTGEKMLQNTMARALWDVVSDAADCQTIQGFHGDLSFLTPDDLENMDADVIIECLPEFQQVDWDEEQLERFGKKIKMKFGNDTGAWGKKDIMQAGKLLGGLSSDDIDKMTLDADIIEVLGQTDLADPAKMFSKFIEDEGISSMVTIDSDTLRSMGKMVCGMSAREMGDLQDSVILEVSNDLSVADCLDEDQLRVIGEKLETAIPSNQWNEVSVEEMGILAAGLSVDKIDLLDEDQLSAIVPDAIKKMDSDTFTEAFTPDKISKLTQDQVGSISRKMMRKMDIGQLIAMENVAEGRSDFNATEEEANVTAAFQIEIPANVSVRLLDTFLEVRNLSSETCMNGLGFGGQADDMLDTDAKRDAFEATLSADEQSFFARIRSSPDHDMSLFTTFEMRMALDYLMESLDTASRDVYIDLRTQFATLSRYDVNDTVTTWPPRLHLLMKPALMCSTLGQMDLEVLNNFCLHLTADDVSTATFIEMLNRCGDCLAAANASRTSDDMIGLMHGYKGRAFFDKLKQWKDNDWDIYHLVFAPDSLAPEDISYITNLNNFRDIAQIYRLADPMFYEKLPPKVMEQLARKLRAALGELSDWSYLHQSMLLPYIVNMPPGLLKRDLTASMVISVIPYLDDVLMVANKKFLKIAAWKVANYLIQNAHSVPRNIKEDAICLVLQYSTHKKLWTQVYSGTELFNYLPKCVNFGVSEERISEVITKVVRTSSFEWSQESIESLGPFIAAVPTSLLKDVNATLMFANWEQISNANFSLNTLRMLWRQMKHMVNLNTADCPTIRKIGRIFLSLEVKEMQKIPDRTMGDCVEHFGELLEDACSENKWLCKKVWEKIRAYATGQGMGIGEVIKYLGDDFIRHLPREDIEAIAIEDLGGVDMLADLRINPEHAPILMRKVAEIKGVVSMENINYTSIDLVKLGGVFFHGATGSEFEALPEDPSLLEMMPHMARFFHNINEKKIEIVLKKLKKIFAVETSSNICLDKALAEQIAMFFTAASATDLKKFSKETQKVILQTIGLKYEYVKRMTRQRIQELFSVMMELDDLGSKSTYDEDDLIGYGYMWCGQKTSEAAKLSEEAVDEFMGTLKDCVHFESDTRGALVSKAIALSGNLSNLLQNEPQRLEDLGSMVIDIDVNLLNTLDADSQQVFVSSTKKVMESMTKVQAESKARPSTEISDSEKAEDQTKLAALGRAVFDMHLSVTFSRRKKRSLSSADCATIQSFNGALSFLTTSEILSLSTSEFTDCLAEFQTTDWTNDQLEAFGIQLIAAFGDDTSSWTRDNVLDAGILLDGLNSSHILGLDVLDDDTLSVLGTFTFTNNAGHILTSYMTTQNISEVSSITSDVLGNTGNLVCGFNSTQLAALESSVVDAASTDLGSVNCLVSEQLSTLSNKIVEIQGTDWSSVTSDTVSSLGVLAGGLPSSVLEDLGSDQISSISTAAITSMDAGTFSTVFTVDKIQSLSSAQANSLTTDQKSVLSVEQLSAVTEVATTTGSESGGPGLTATSSTLCLMIFVAMISLVV